MKIRIFVPLLLIGCQSAFAQSGWFIQDRVVDVGRAWLAAHVGYWRHPAIGDDLATLITT